MKIDSNVTSFYYLYQIKWQNKGMFNFHVIIQPKVLQIKTK